MLHSMNMKYFSSYFWLHQVFIAAYGLFSSCSEWSQLFSMVFRLLIVGCVCVCVCVLSRLSCLTLCDPMDCTQPGSSVRGIFQASILGQVAMLSSKGSSLPRNKPVSPVTPALQADSLPQNHQGSPLIVVASLIAESRLQGMQATIVVPLELQWAQQLWHMGLVAPQLVGPF